MADVEKENERSGLNQAAQSAATAARAGKAIAKAAGKAASGNVVGAAKEIALNETTRTIILSVIVALLAIPILVFAAIPTTLFGAMEDVSSGMDQSIVSDLTDAGKNVEDYLNDAPGVSGEVGGRTRESFLSSITKKIQSFFHPSAETSDKVSYDNSAYYVMRDEAKAKETLQYNADKIIDLFEKRKSQYSDLLDDIVDDFAETPPAKASDYDHYNVTSEFQAPDITINEAIQFMCVNAVQGGNGTTAIGLSDLLSWIGYSDSLWRKTDRYTVDGRSFYTYDWSGDFIPQYLFEQRKTQEINGWPITDCSAEADSFLEKVYYVDKSTGITITDNVSYDTEYDSKGDPYTVSTLTRNICLSVTLLNVHEIADTVVGFWAGDLSEQTHAGDNRVLPGVSHDYYRYSWTDPNGHPIRRLAGYQSEYLSDMQIASRQFLGLSRTNLLEIDYSALGAEVSDNASCENLLRVAANELGTVGGYPYWNYGRSGDNWCAWFIKWCMEKAGLRDLSGIVSGSCSATWRNFGGIGPYGGTSSHGACIPVDDTMLVNPDSQCYIPQRGDLVIFCTPAGTIAHIGIVDHYSIASNDLVTIEGNSGSYDTYQSAVLIRHRTTTQRYTPEGSRGYYKGYNIYGFIHPTYPV